MKQFLFLLGLGAVLLRGADLMGVQSVYIMPMGKGFDQHLANRLVNQRVFQVVTDPKLADAIFTDRLGEAFQTQLESISPSPEPAKPAGAEKAEADKDAPERESSGAAGLLTDTVNRLSMPNSNFGRAKGTFFLVDAKSRHIIWSVFDQAKDSSAKELDRTAGDIVSRLMREMKKK